MLSCQLRALRDQRNWSQAELSRRAGLSRPEISAIETGRVVPSVHAALSLSRALGVGVEKLFSLGEGTVRFAFEPTELPARVWLAEVGGQRWAFPCEPGPLGLLAHDAVVTHSEPLAWIEPPPTLVIAGCDPAIGVLSERLGREGVRVLALSRSSSVALELLSRNVVHAAGVHLGRAGGSSANARQVKRKLGTGHHLLRWAAWDEGLVTAPETRIRSTKAQALSRLRWVGREPGSGARACLDELFSGQRTPSFVVMARDHAEVTQAIRLGIADAGVCVRLLASDAGLAFHPVRREAYDFCYRTELEGDPMLRLLSSTVGQPGLRRVLGELPGYDVGTTGESAQV